MMVAQRSSALPYESLPTEDREVPSSITYRDADSRTPTVTHHPIPMGPHHPDRGTWITCTLVSLLVVLASILGIIVGFAAQRAHYPAIYSLAEGITPHAGGSGGVAHGSSWGGYESGRSNDSGTGGGDSTYSSESSGEHSSTSYSGVASSTEIYGHSGEGGTSTEFGWRSSSKFGGQGSVTTESGKPLATDSTRPAALVAVSSTTHITTRPPTTTTTPTTPAPTQTTTPTTPAPTTASTYPVTLVTTAALLSTTPSSAVDEKTASTPSGYTTDDGVRASSGSVVTDGYNSSLGVVDYMVVMQKKLPVGLVLTIFLAVILVTVGSLAAIIYVVKRKTTKRRRRAHVRRAINELRAQDKSNLLQSDEEEG